MESNFIVNIGASCCKVRRIVCGSRIELSVCSPAFIYSRLPTYHVSGIRRRGEAQSVQRGFLILQNKLYQEGFSKWSLSLRNGTLGFRIRGLKRTFECPLQAFPVLGVVPEASVTPRPWSFFMDMYHSSCCSIVFQVLFSKTRRRKIWGSVVYPTEPQARPERLRLSGVVWEISSRLNVLNVTYDIKARSKCLK